MDQPVTVNSDRAKLRFAFAAMRRTGTVAVILNTSNERARDVIIPSMLAERGLENYVYFTSQASLDVFDADSNIGPGKRLPLWWGEYSTAVGASHIRALKQAGLCVQWDGTFYDTIFVYRGRGA